jgi:hypothetical protein
MVKRKNLKITIGIAGTAVLSGIKSFGPKISSFFKAVVPNALIENDHDRQHYNKSYDS